MTLCQSRALRAALLAALNGGPDAALVVEMVESDVDETSEDEGYDTSPEVDFDLFNYWALGLNIFLLRIDLYKEGEDGYWTL